jgi:hypothetical protein
MVDYMEWTEPFGLSRKVVLTCRLPFEGCIAVQKSYASADYYKTDADALNDFERIFRAKRVQYPEEIKHEQSDNG